MKWSHFHSFFIMFSISVMHYCPAQTDSDIMVFMSIEEALKTPEKVRHLSLQDQNLSELPEALSNLKNLEYLDLSINNFKSIPNVVFKLTSLKELHIRGAYSHIDKYDRDALLDSISPEIGRLLELEVLDLDYNYLSSLPAEITSLKKLKHLSVYHNYLNNTAIQPICKLRSLEFLDLGGNDITDLPKDFKNLQNLHTLHLDNSWSEGVPVGTELLHFPMEICALTNLEDVSMTGMYIERIPKQINQLKKLKNLNLFFNPFTKLPNEICALTNLESLNVGIICIGGFNKYRTKPFSFPKNICNLKKLHKLDYTDRFVSEQEIQRISACLKLNE